MFRGEGARNEAASVLTNLGNVAHDHGDDLRAVRFYDGARQLFDALGDRRGAAMCLNDLALLAAAHADLDHAIELGRWAHDHFHAVGDVRGERAVGFVQATIVGDLADLAWVLGAHDRGLGFATEAVTAVIDWLGETAVRRIEAHIHPRHEASRAVGQRIGMVRTGERDDDDEIWAADFDVAAQ